ncbi:MAG: formylglycine-generating enzyme family protein, partial [Vicinamibacterales bacterium]
PETSPSPRGWCKLSYDVSRSRVVLYGGANATSVFEETWEWDGSNWIQELPGAAPTNPSLSYGHASSYDGKRALTVTHGVLGTWDYGPVAPADVTSYGVGCTTSSSATLNLKQLGWSRLWLGERLELDIEGAPSFSLGLMLWGLSDASFGAGIPLPLDLRLIGFSTGPCYLSTSADLTSEAVFPPTTRYTSFAMPVDPFLLGLELYLQMAYFDAPANPSNPPVVTSNALKMKLGQKATLAAAPFEPNPALNMVRIGAGTFQMGSPVTPLDVAPYFNQPNSQPVHSTTITQPFWICKYEITQAQYQMMMGSNPSFFQGSGYLNAPQRPVEQVSWHDAVAYCAALNLTESAAGRVPVGYQYRLPTEAEWEFTCRANTSSEWHTGNTLTTSQANFGNNLGQTTVCGSYSANPWGLHDMHGNVWEWCLDANTSGANYTSSPVSDPHVQVGQYRIYRGGGWIYGAYGCRSAFRNYDNPATTISNVGFRIVLGPTKVFYPPADLRMVQISAGTFSMGSSVTPNNVTPYFNQSDSQPVHPVTITQPFWMGKYEVTQAEYQAVLGTNPSFFFGPQKPVERVSWTNAMAYCAALTASETAAGRVPAGYQYRLPTEAEWEYCYRAGTATEYCFGHTLACGQANFNFNEHTSSSCAIGQTANVGSYPPNAWGLNDVVGNVFEWCLDGWNASANYPSSALSDPYVSNGLYRIVRGGSWNCSSEFCRAAWRDYGDPVGTFDNVGFRVVLAPVRAP